MRRREYIVVAMNWKFIFLQITWRCARSNHYHTIQKRTTWSALLLFSYVSGTHALSTLTSLAWGETKRRRRKGPGDSVNTRRFWLQYSVMWHGTARLCSSISRSINGGDRSNWRRRKRRCRALALGWLQKILLAYYCTLGLSLSQLSTTAAAAAHGFHRV